MIESAKTNDTITEIFFKFPGVAILIEDKAFCFRKFLETVKKVFAFLTLINRIRIIEDVEWKSSYVSNVNRNQLNRYCSWWQWKHNQVNNGSW